jgi:hypothetical protein
MVRLILTFQGISTMLTSQVEVYVEIQSVALFIKRGESLFKDNEAKRLKNMHA